MKKFLGISRNRLSQFQSARMTGLKRKNRFKSIGKEDELQISQPSQTNNFITSTTQNSSGQQSQSSKTLDIYEEAKQNLKEAGDYKKKIATQCKLRITAFKESEAKKYDQNICNLSRKAVQHLLVAQKTLSTIRSLRGSNQAEQKYYRNMEKSLAQQLRQMSKQLRAQQKQHFDRIRSYQKGTANKAIQLSETQKQKMKGDAQFDQQTSIAMIQQVEQSHRDSQINQLVKSINTLSSIYKQLNQLVIEQGSIIDRIDFNIQQTFVHVEKGNKHLRGAQQKASNAYAQKCMVFLLSLIIIFAIILGFKYSK